MPLNLLLCRSATSRSVRFANESDKDPVNFPKLKSSVRSCFNENNSVGRVPLISVLPARKYINRDNVLILADISPRNCVLLMSKLVRLERVYKFSGRVPVNPFVPMRRVFNEGRLLIWDRMGPVKLFPFTLMSIKAVD